MMLQITQKNAEGWIIPEGRIANSNFRRNLPSGIGTDRFR